MRFSSSPIGCLLFAFSSSSLFMLPTWISIYESRGAPYDDKFIINHQQILDAAKLDYAGGLIATCVLSLILFATLLAFRQRSETSTFVVASVIAAALSAIFLNYIRASYLPWASLQNILNHLDKSPMATIIILFMTVPAIGFSVYRLWRLLPHVILIGIPIGLVLFANGIGAMARIGTDSLSLGPRTLASAPPGNMSDNRRVIWLIFDEFDYRLGFEKRPHDVTLKTLDKLRKTSFFATNAKTPSSSTTVSLPSLLSGITYPKTTISDDGIIVTSPKSGEIRPWSNEPSIFKAEHDAGRRIAVFGQDYIPYCRLFGAFVNVCWEIGEDWSANQGLFHRALSMFRQAMAYVPLLNRRIIPEKFDHSIQYNAFRDAVTQSVRDHGFDLVFAHWMVPHSPYVFDRKTGRFATVINENSHDGYFSNMVLADLLIARVLKSLEETTRERDWALIISSDHHWRRSKDFYDGVSDTRVPFIVHLSGSGNGAVQYERPVRTVATRQLVSALMNGEINDHRDVANFLERWHNRHTLETKP